MGAGRHRDRRPVRCAVYRLAVIYICLSMSHRACTSAVLIPSQQVMCEDGAGVVGLVLGNIICQSSLPWPIRLIRFDACVTE